MPLYRHQYREPDTWGSTTSFARLSSQLRQSHHYTRDMRLRVHKQHADTYKCQRGDQHSRSHKELRSEHPQSTIRMKRGIVSRYLELAGETGNTDNARCVRIRHVRRRTVCQSEKDAARGRAIRSPASSVHVGCVTANIRRFSRVAKSKVRSGGLPSHKMIERLFESHRSRGLVDLA
jgi:hypothetical protein